MRYFQIKELIHKNNVLKTYFVLYYGLVDGLKKSTKMYGKLKKCFFLPNESGTETTSSWYLY